MRRLWIHHTIDAPADTVWQLLTDPADWSTWGPSIRHAHVDGERLTKGVTGSVTSLGGVVLPFEITDFDERRRWAWTVAGVEGTDHSVEELGPDQCRVGFGVPWPFAPYLAVCRVALARLEAMAVRSGDAADNT